METKILLDVKESLEKLNIYELRQVARAVGVHRPADGKKSRVVEAILEIAQGKATPEAPSLRGAPPKSQTYDEQIVSQVKTCREYYLALGGENHTQTHVNQMQVNDSSKALEEVYEGILDRSGKYAFLRVNGCVATPLKDVFVHDTFITRFNLKEGDYIVCKGKRKSLDEADVTLQDLNDRIRRYEVGI
ncbi:MAG: hypothetical protein K2O67_05770, partial [Clostridia bacterium]|nr:hypothetical protein [Clostridia bacterium]